MKAIKRRLEKWLGQVTRMGEMKNAYEIVFGNVERDGINLWWKCWAEQTTMKDAYNDKQT